MLRRDLLVLFCLALLARAFVASFQDHPGYMDAYYYTVGGQRLADGLGFTEPVVWHYLDDPASLPRPSHLYWMPLPSILAALSMALFDAGFSAAQLPFVLLSASLPVLAYVIAWRAVRQRRAAWIAGLLLIFSGFYVPFWGVPESFTPYAVFGALALLAAGAGASKRAAFVAGVCAGLAHLTRADGLLLLVPLLWFQFEKVKGEGGGQKSALLSYTACLLVGYLLVMLPWYLRNVAVAGAPISPAGTQTLWLCEYDELFSFGVRLDLNYWLGCGPERMLATKLRALGTGAVHLAAENGLVFLTPLMAAGMWRLRRERLFRPALLYLLLLYLAMTLAFTFVGDRGGLFHSSAALMPFLCAAAPIGLESAVNAVARRRRTWNAGTANRVFGAGVVVLAAALSAAIAWGRVIGPDWNRADATYREAGAWLAERGDTQSVVMAGNPPGFTYHTGHPSIVVPFGNGDTAFAVAQRFDARWLILDANRPEPLARLYDAPDSDPRFILSATFGEARLFQIISH